MADPTIYEPGYDFTATDKGASLNTELDNIAASVQSVADALADIRRSDGNLTNQIVKLEALDPLAMAALSDEVTADLAAQLEVALAAAEVSAAASAASAVGAALSKTNADTAASDATAAAVSASGSATAAAASVTSAATSASSATVSATSATGSATAASGSATAAAGSASAAAASATAAATTLANSRIAFSARKSADQTGIVTATATKLVFPTEIFDFGAFYDAANSRFTPSAGKYRLSAGAGWSTGIVDARQVTVEIWKNGAVFRVFGTQVSGTTDSALVSGDCLVEANGTDYFEVYGTGAGVGNKTVVGTVSVTYFEGEAI